MQDYEIVALFLERNEQAIEQCSRKYGRALQQMSMRITCDYESVKECENDTYYTAWKLIPPNEPRNYLFPFLGRIIKHLSLDVCRKKNSIKRSAEFTELTKELEQCLSGGSVADTPEELLEAKELSEAISSFLRTLPKEQRILFVRRYWYLYSVKDLAEQLGWSESKVKTSLHRIRNRLRLFLQKEGFEI